jgi:cytochrome b involved in lipid metabolism
VLIAFWDCRGGEEVILDCAGKDGTAAFDEVGHSKEAHEQLRELLIGPLDQAVCVLASLSRRH